MWPGYIWMYFDILNDLNLDLKKLNNLDGKSNNWKREKIYYDIFEKITQLIPYRFINEEKGSLKLKEKNGILELLNGDEPFVREYLDNMINLRNESLSCIKTIRDNVEHSPHRILLCAMTGTKNFSSITLNYHKLGKVPPITNPDDIYCCKCNSIMVEKIVLDLNKLFIDIRNRIKELIKDGKVEPYFAKIYSKYRFPTQH